MGVKQIVPELYAVALGAVNVFLIDSDELTLIDTGYAKNTDEIVEAVRTIGKQPSDVKHILVTHCHPDHAGSLAALKRITHAPVYMHPIDAAVARVGKLPLDIQPSPGLVNNLLFRLFIGSKGAEYEAAETDHEILDGDELDIAGGIRAIQVPGHSAGHLAFFWPKHGGVLFAADVAANIFGLGYSLGYADIEEGKRSLAKLAALDFEVACFGHGKAIVGGASDKFKQKWGA